MSIYVNRILRDNFFFQHPVGSSYRQGYNDPSPVDMGWFGKWEVWSDRADRYGLSTTLPSSYPDYYTLVGQIIGIGSTPTVIYHVLGSDYQLFTFKSSATAYTVPQELNPVFWNFIEPDERVDRRFLDNPWNADDWEIGYEVQSGYGAGRYITEIIVPGGKFPSIEGGFRPTLNGGVQQDAVRQMTGSTRLQATAGGSSVGDWTEGGVFFALDDKGVGNFVSQGGSGTSNRGLGFQASRGVPTANQNQVVNAATRLWRLIELT
jgi:hypothetical protein